MGCALIQTSFSVRFSKTGLPHSKVDAGEKNGKKANTGDVEIAMINSLKRSELFWADLLVTEEWLKSRQIKTFFTPCSINEKSWEQTSNKSDSRRNWKRINR
jgi:hypothetical protein